LNAKKYSLFLSVILLICFSTGVIAEASGLRFNMSYIYFGNSAGYTGSVDKTQKSLNEVSPNYFTVDSSGNLMITNAYSAQFVKDMHDRGILVVPFLQNDWNDPQSGKNALANRESLAQQLADFIYQKGLDGVNIDIENMTENERSAYVAFMRVLREKMPDKIISVAVAANPGGWTKGWQASYDYDGLADYCDYLMIMAYDESWATPGPVSSMSFVEKSIKYALSQNVRKDQIVLGLPFYGRIWADNGGYPQAGGVSNVKIEQLLASYSGTVEFDRTTKSARAVITVKETDTKPAIGGKTLNPGTYTIWYENEQATKEKLALVEKYDIKGTGSWSLGQETAATWNYYKLWLNDCTFGDIQNNWAKDYIFNAYTNGWITGISPDNFSPEGPLTRAQAATMLVRRLGLPVEANAEYSFDDTKGSWAEAYINTARKNNMISGTGGNQFAPEAPVTREEIAVMLNNILGYEGGSVSVFADVTAQANPWSYQAINALSANGVINGYPDGNYHPKDTLTRAQMTALISRLDIA
jgi:spore germination protein YaaH